jgi:hypothetical protein
MYYYKALRVTIQQETTAAAKSKRKYRWDESTVMEADNT